MTKHVVKDQGDLHKYYAAIPNIICMLGLNPYELALYVHLKRAAGNDGGVCWKSRATIARESGMSSGMVTKARQALEAPRPELDGLPLITVIEEPSKTGGKTTCKVAITDIWTINMSKFSTSPHDVAPSPYDVDKAAPSPHDGQRHTVTLSTSPHDHKEEPIKNNNEEDKRDFLSKIRSDPLYSHIDLDYQLELMRRWLQRPANKGRRMTERFVLNWLAKIDRPVEMSPNGNKPVDRAAKEAELKQKMGWDKFEHAS